MGLGTDDLPSSAHASGYAYHPLRGVIEFVLLRNALAYGIAALNSNGRLGTHSSTPLFAPSGYD
jgi:hypothetical protein